jgi:hypothetical protein
MRDGTVAVKPLKEAGEQTLVPFDAVPSTLKQLLKV